MIKVLITGVGGGGNGEQLIKALRLAKTTYKIYGADITNLSKGLKEVDIPIILPRANEINYIDKLIECIKINKIQVLFPGSEIELKIISQCRERIKENTGVFIPINDDSLIKICMDKNETNLFLIENGFNSIKSFRVSDLSKINEISDFPVILKPSVGGGGSANVFIAQSAEELYVFSKYLLGIYKEFIVQEYIGNSEEEYTVGILHDMQGNFINSIAVRRNIKTALSNRIVVPNRTEKSKHGDTLVVSNGISQGWIGKFAEVTEQCEKIASKLGTKSAINIQCRVELGKLFIFEINPRYSGTSSLRAMVGYNEPDILIRKEFFKEEPTVRFPFKEGYIARGLKEQFIEYDFLSEKGK